MLRDQFDVNFNPVTAFGHSSHVENGYTNKSYITQLKEHWASIIILAQCSFNCV